MSVPSQLRDATDAHSSTPTPPAVSSFPYLLPPFQSVNSAVLNDKCSTGSMALHHRYSCPSISVPSLPHSIRSTESIEAYPVCSYGVSEISLPVKNSPQRDGIAGRRRKSLQLPKLIGCVSPQDGDDVIQEMTSFDAHECTSDARDYVVERPSLVSAMRRKLDSADVHASSPINSTGVHIVIDDGNDSNDVTSSNDAVFVFGDDECTSGTAVPSSDRS